MPDASSNLSLPFIQPGQAQKHVTHNEGLRILDTLVQLTVLDATLSDPPGAPVAGDRFIVAGSPTGDWAGKADAVAVWDENAWVFFVPVAGWSAWDQAAGLALVFDGTGWVEAAPDPETLGLLGINATADATNRLSVTSPAALFNHEAADIRVKMNKAASSDTASLLYQTGWSGRAEIGTSGDDDFHFKVSPDGSTWHDALIIDKDNGDLSVLAVSGRIPVHNTGNSVFLGEGAGASDDLSDNRSVFLGKDAGGSNTTGSQNSASGCQALLDVTTGSNNTAIGYDTGRGITTGSGNTIIGANVAGLSAGLMNTVILADGAGNQRLSFDSSGVMDYKQSPTAATANPTFSHYLTLKLNGTTYYVPAHNATF